MFTSNTAAETQYHLRELDSEGQPLDETINTPSRFQRDNFRP